MAPAVRPARPPDGELAGPGGQEPEDRDTAFILLWIALNAAYADLDAESLDERGRFAQFAADLIVAIWLELGPDIGLR